IQGQSVICSDGEPAYRSIATLTDCEHIRVKLKEKTQAPNLNLAKINAYHSQLKQLINGSCRGVNTEYLHLYLGWGRRWTQAGEFGKPIVREMLELALPSRPMGLA
ncbi:MAG: transposase, partial [Coleofasciculus sp. C2-GNP5-27]